MLAMSFGDLQGFIESTQHVSNVDDLVRVLLKHVEPMGYDRMIFCLFSDHTHIGLKAGVGHLCNYPQDWMSDYMQRGFDKIDPVITTLRASARTFTWEEMAKTLSLTKDQKLCLNMGEEAKLYNGVATPIWGPNRFSALGFATSEKLDACDASPITLDVLNAMSHHFYLVFERLHQNAKQSTENYKTFI